jgi:hypothetical protein
MEQNVGKMRFYPCFVCLFLWFFAFHSLILMFTHGLKIHLFWGNITIFLKDYKFYYLLPKCYYSLQTAITATIFSIFDREVIINIMFK